MKFEYYLVRDCDDVKRHKRRFLLCHGRPDPVFKPYHFSEFSTWHHYTFGKCSCTIPVSEDSLPEGLRKMNIGSEPIQVKFKIVEM